MAGIAPPFQVPKVHISSHFSPPRRAPGAETCINRAATVKFTLSQLLPTIGRRAGNIPASDPDTHLGHWRHLNECRGSNCIDLGALSLLNCSQTMKPTPTTRESEIQAPV